MAAYKLTFFWEHRNHGWTENFFVEAGSLAAALGIGNAITEKMLYPRGLDTILRAIRSYETDGSRRSALATKNIRAASTPNPNAPLSFDRENDEPSAALVLAVEGVGGSSRNLWLRGIADSLIEYDVQGLPILSGLATNITNVIEQDMLESGAWRIRYLTPIGTIPWIPITQLAASAGGEDYTEVTFNAAPGVAVNDYIYFRNVDPCEYGQLRGHHRVTAIQGNVVTIRARWRHKVSAFFPVELDARKRAYLYDPFATVELLKFGKHDTGRPTNLPRGRQKGVSCR